LNGIATANFRYNDGTGFDNSTVIDVGATEATLTFEATLPSLYEYAYWEVWITDSNGNLGHIPTHDIAIVFNSSMVEKWNYMYAMLPDVGKTLGTVNASLNYNNIHWAVIVIEYINGTTPFQRSFVYGTSVNAALVVIEESQLKIYCTDLTATWTHTYG
jgi:hypothetical protein